MNEIEHVLAVQNELGEGPIWVPEEKALYWLDIKNSLVFRFYPSTGKHESFAIEVPITALAMRDSGGFVAATYKGFAFWNLQDQELHFIADPEADQRDVVFNDGAVDRQGRFWAGTVNPSNPEAREGCLHRLDPDGHVHKMDSGFMEPNGMGWSPDSRTMYFTDSVDRVIWAYDYDPTAGAISNRRPFVELPEEEGLPDGLAVDSEGYVWSAQWDGWKLSRYDPSGKREREVQLPVQQVTSFAFVGENLDELYITSAWIMLNDEKRKEQPWAGDLLRIRVDVRGLAEPKFAG